MRKKTTTHIYTFFLLVLLILILAPHCISTQQTTTTDDQLMIFLFESDASSYAPLQENIVIQQKNYDIVVRHANQLTPAYDVTITLTPLQGVYITKPEMPEVSFTAPLYEQHNEFIIRASKQGYTTTEKQIIVSKGHLLMSFDRQAVEEQKSFSVTVTDQNNAAVSNAIVFITTHDHIQEITDTTGTAYIKAPSVQEDSDITLTVVKSGYQPTTRTIRVIHTHQGILSTITTHILNILPIIIAFIMVFISMIIVKIRKNKSINLQPKPQNNNPLQKPTTPPTKQSAKHYTQTTHTKQQPPLKKEPTPAVRSKGSHVEIIRIRDNECNKKEIKQVIQPKKQIIKDAKKQPISKNTEYEWFSGTEYMKYKIDKLTGDENKSCVDNWFVGEDMLQFKLDKKVTDKKQKKKQNTEST